MDPPLAEIEHQRLRRQIEDLHWDLRTLKRRVEERDAQLRDARGETDRLKKRSRDAERDLAAAQGDTAVAVAEAATERRRSGSRRAELQALRAELQSVRDRAASAVEEQRLRLDADGRDRLSAALATAEAEAKDRAAVLTASLRGVTAERDELLKKRGEAARQIPSPSEDVAARAKELEALLCTLAARDAELHAIVDATDGFVHHADALGGPRGSGKSGALRGALAAATEARRAGLLATELQEERSSLKTKVSRLREDLEEAAAAKEKAVAAAAGAATSAAVAAAAAATSQQPPEIRPSVAWDAEAKAAELEAKANAKQRVQAAEDALQKALTGAERAWRTVSFCLADENRSSEVFEVAAPRAPDSPPWNPKSDPGLHALVAGTEALASAHRRRGQALRRATVAARAKAACAREARRREVTEARARENAEGRLEEALAALDNHQLQHGQQAGWRSGGDRPGPGDGGEPRVGSLLSLEQREHLRQIRSEVDRLEGHNRTLRQSLAGGGRLRENVSERGRAGGFPAKRLLFPQAVGVAGEKPSDQGWERGEGTNGSEPPSAGTPSPARSWIATSDQQPRKVDWPCCDSEEGRERAGDARARAPEACVAYCSPPRDDGSGGTVVPGWTS